MYIITAGTSYDHQTLSRHDLLLFLQKQFSPAKRTHVACADTIDQVLVYNLHTQELVTAVSGFDVRSITFKSERELAIATNQQLVLWDVDLEREIKSQDINSSAYGVVAKGDYVIVYTDPIWVWDTRKNSLKRGTTEGHVSELHILPHNEQFITCQQSEFVVWDIFTVKIIRKIEHGGSVFSFDFWNDNSILMGNGGLLQVFNLETSEITTSMQVESTNEITFVKRIGTDRVLVVHTAKTEQNYNENCECLLYNTSTQNVEISRLFIDENAAFRPCSVKGSLVIYFDKGLTTYDIITTQQIVNLKVEVTTAVDLAVW